MFKQRLERFITQAWQRQAPWLIALRPLSGLYRTIFLWQKHHKQAHAYRAPVAVMVIGNITIGGSGKTPLIIALVQYLQQHGVAVGVISRGYGGTVAATGGAALVTAQALPKQVGDEPLLIVQHTHVPLAVSANRRAAIELLLVHYPNLQLILSDDGLQHFALARDIEWAVVDSARGFGNGKLLPEGFLREPLRRLTELTVIEHSTQAQSSLNMHLVAGQPYCLGDTTAKFDNSQVYAAVAGIGYPQRFFDSLSQLDIQFQPFAFGDHQHYQHEELLAILKTAPILTTAKDAVKIYQLWCDFPQYLAQVWVLPVEAKLSPAVFCTLQQQLADFGIRVT